MSENADMREHSEHSPRLRVDAALKAVAFFKRTIEALVFSVQLQSRFLPI